MDIILDVFFFKFLKLKTIYFYQICCNWIPDYFLIMLVLDCCRHRRGLFGYSFLSCMALLDKLFHAFIVFGNICRSNKSNFAFKESEELSQHNAW